MKINVALLLGAALLALSASPTLAQTTPSPGASGSQMKCWDANTNQVRDRVAGSPSGSSSGPTVGSGTPSGSSSTQSGSGSSAGSGSTTTPGATAARPPEAAGLPNC